MTYPPMLNDRSGSQEIAMHTQRPDLGKECRRCGAVGGFGCYECIPPSDNDAARLSTVHHMHDAMQHEHSTSTWRHMPRKPEPSPLVWVMVALCGFIVAAGIAVAVTG